MANPIEASRAGCALHGVLQTLQEIEGVVPVIHSTAGCGVQQYLGSGLPGGCGGSGYSGGLARASTNVNEKHIIFGGGSRLREQLKNTIKVIEGRFYAVVTGCSAEMVGDDTPAMIKESREQGNLVGYVAAPGFRGDVYSGYNLAVKGLLEQFPAAAGAGGQLQREKDPLLVNILGIVPSQQVFWQGHLAELKQVLETYGIKANTLVGFGQSLEDWELVPKAALNIVLSPRADELAQWLEETYGIPAFYSYLPVGADETNRWVESVAAALPQPFSVPQNRFEFEEKRFAHYLEKLADVYYDRHLQKQFAIVGESAFVVGVSRFLVQSFGFIPAAYVITDRPSEEWQEKIASTLNDLLPESGAKVTFTEDYGSISDLLKESEAELILGSTLEEKLSLQLNIPFTGISFPLADQLVLSKSYIGYNGAFALLEDIASSILSWPAK